jgi:ABC-type antimicrobial peptide transport system permease subunit
MFHSLFVRDRAILFLPLSYFEGELDGDTYLSLNISTSQHKETAQCLTDMGYFGTMDVSSETENLRQVYMILKLSICIFAMLMIAIIGLNVCNTMSNTIYVRRGEFAVLRSVGMTTKGLMKMLLLEATLYGIKALLPALAVSLAVHYILYYLICTGMTPFVFYIRWGVYGVAIVAVCVIVVVAMMFSAGNVRKVDIITALSFG